MLTIEGSWSKEKNIGEKKYGRLQIDDFGNSDLHLPIAFGRTFEELPKLLKYDYLYGLTNDNDFVILKSCRETSNKMSADSNISSERVYIFNKPSLNDQEFLKCKVSFDRMGPWLNKSDVQITPEQDPNNNFKRIYINAAPSVIWKEQFEGFNLSFICDILTNVELQNIISIKSDFFMEIEFNEALFFDESEGFSYIINLVEKINVLMNVLIGEDVYTNSISFIGNDIKVNVYEYGMQQVCYNKIDKSTLSMNFSVIADTFKDTIDKWIKDYDNLIGSAKIVRSYFFDTGRRKRVIDIPTFIKDVCVGIESYSRNMRKINIEDDIDFYNERYSRIMRAVNSESDDAKWLKGKLKYANEASLRKRLKLIFTELSSELPTLVPYLCLNDKKKYEILIDRIVKTRNFYTHYDLSSDEIIYNDSEAYNVSIIMIEILRVIIFKSCGIPSGIIDSFVKENQRILIACENMEFINLLPTMIAQMAYEINSNLFLFRTSYFSDSEVYSYLKNGDFTCLITLDVKYDNDYYGKYKSDESFKRYMFKIPKNLNDDMSSVYSKIDKICNKEIKVAIWASDEAVRIIIENHYKSL